MKGKYDATQTALQHGVMEGLLQGSYDNIHTPKREYYVAKDTLPSTYYKCGDFSTFSFFFCKRVTDGCKYHVRKLQLIIFEI